MGKASSSKKVARAARAGSTRSASRQRSTWAALAWPAAILLVLVLGVVLVVTSRSDRQSVVAEAPTLTDHWHAAYGVYDCGTFLPPFTDRPDVRFHNLHTHGDGLIHIHPQSTSATGTGATLRVFADTVGLDLAEGTFTLPTGETRSDGDDCNGTPGVVRLGVWESAQDAVDPDVPATIIEGNPADYRPQNGEVVVLAFGPPDEEIRPPDSLPELAAPSDVVPSGG